MLLCKQNKKNQFHLINKSLVFNLIAIQTKNLSFFVLYIFRLFTWLFFLSLFYEGKKDPLQWTNCREIEDFFILETGLNN